MKVRCSMDAEKREKLKQEYDAIMSLAADADDGDAVVIAWILRLIERERLEARAEEHDSSCPRCDYYTYFHAKSRNCERGAYLERKLKEVAQAEKAGEK
jgi:hypothetical protein